MDDVVRCDADVRCEILKSELVKSGKARYPGMLCLTLLPAENLVPIGNVHTHITSWECSPRSYLPGMFTQVLHTRNVHTDITYWEYLHTTFGYYSAI